MSAIVREEDKKRIPSYGKMHSAGNTRYKKSLLKLKQQEYLMEKSLANSMENARFLEPEILRSVLDNVSDVARNRQTFLDSVRRSLKEIVEEVRSVKSVTDRPEDIRNLDANAYRQQLMRVSRKIQDFKESCQLRTLSQEQTALESELRGFESNLPKYEKVIGSAGKPTFAGSAMENKRRHDYKEIHDFHALIAKTGHTHNWSDEDHLLFLKTRKKCGNIPALVAAMQVKCPDLTAETIVNHEAWYKIYLDLREKQRTTVKEWRKQKDAERTRKIGEEETVIDALEEASPLEKANSNKNRMENISHVTDKRERSVKKTKDTLDERANRTKELIKQWRTEKENKRWIDEEQSRILMESKLAAQEKRKAERFKKIQDALAEYRRKKSMENSSKISKNVSRPKYNPTLITAFRKQDEEYTNKRRNLIEKFRKSTKSRAMKIVKSQATRKRDYSTLLNWTEVWRERCKMQDLDTKESKKLQYIKDVPRLYIRWRNEESTEIKDALALF